MAYRDPGGPHVGPMNFAIWDAMLRFAIPFDPPYTVAKFLKTYNPYLPQKALICGVSLKPNPDLC